MRKNIVYGRLCEARDQRSFFQSIPEDVRVWLLHVGGYTQARLLERLPDGRVRVAVAGESYSVGYGSFEFEIGELLLFSLALIR